MYIKRTATSTVFKNIYNKNGKEKIKKYLVIFSNETK
jgi:hypothetical protein